MELKPGPHGGDGARLASALGIAPGDVLDLSMSLNPCAPDIAVAAERLLGSLRSYPDDARATDALAEAIGVDRSRVVLTNGAAEAISLVASAMPVGFVEEPEFSLYRRHLHEIRVGAPRWRSDPHNPTGVLAPLDDRAAVRDEAFYPLATGRWSRGDADSVTIGSLTKTFGCPGLRMGYVVAPDAEFARRIDALRPRWSVGSLATAIIPELVNDAPLGAWASAIAGLRSDLESVLADHGFEALPSSANFVWIPDGRGMRERLLPTGILARSGASFGHPAAVRLAVPDAGGLERLAKALAATEP